MLKIHDNKITQIDDHIIVSIISIAFDVPIGDIQLEVPDGGYKYEIKDYDIDEEIDEEIECIFFSTKPDMIRLFIPMDHVCRFVSTIDDTISPTDLSSIVNIKTNNIKLIEDIIECDSVGNYSDDFICNFETTKDYNTNMNHVEFMQQNRFLINLNKQYEPIVELVDTDYGLYVVGHDLYINVDIITHKSSILSGKNSILLLNEITLYSIMTALHSPDIDNNQHFNVGRNYYCHRPLSIRMYEDSIETSPCLHPDRKIARSNILSHTPDSICLLCRKQNQRDLHKKNNSDISLDEYTICATDVNIDLDIMEDLLKSNNYELVSVSNKTRSRDVPPLHEKNHNNLKSIYNLSKQYNVERMTVVSKFQRDVYIDSLTMFNDVFFRLEILLDDISKVECVLKTIQESITTQYTHGIDEICVLVEISNKLSIHVLDQLLNAIRGIITILDDRVLTDIKVVNTGEPFNEAECSIIRRSVIYNMNDDIDVLSELRNDIVYLCDIAPRQNTTPSTFDFFNKGNIK